MSDFRNESKAFQMTGFCGIYCAECECAKAGDDPKLMEYLIGRGMKAENLPCPGCRSVAGNCPAIGEKCATYQCAVDKGVDFCFECDDFPCDKLNPAADRANILPHNLKAFNLCCIQNQGIEEFSKKAASIKNKYYKGKMMIGKGPQTE